MVLTNGPRPPPLSRRGMVRFVSIKSPEAQVGRFEKAGPMLTPAPTTTKS
jgi:hypothetical protein